MWGLLVPGSNASAELRSTPTHVGFTPPCCSHGRRSAVHPHARRVYRPGRPTMTAATDLFPRAWGLHVLVHRLSALCRFIPTCVGFTIIWTTKLGTRTVHPHVRWVYTEIKSKISCISSKTALLPAEKFKILFLVKIKGSAVAFLDHTIFRDQSPPGLHFEIALHL